MVGSEGLALSIQRLPGVWAVLHPDLLTPNPNNVTANNLPALSGLHLTIHNDLAVSNQQFCLTACGNQALEFQNLIKLGRFLSEGHGSHMGCYCDGL